MISLLLTLALTGCSSSNEQPVEPQPASVEKTPPPTPRPSPAAVADAEDAEDTPDAEEPADAEDKPDDGEAVEADEPEEAPAVEEKPAAPEAPAVEAADGATAAADGGGKDSDEPAEEAEPPEEEAPPEDPAEEPEELEEEPEPAPVGTATYTLNAGQGLLWIQVFKDTETIGADLSHNHVIAAYGWSGTATWDPDDASKCSLSIKVPVSGLDPDAPNLRKSFGLEGELSESQRGDVKNNMLAKDQLNGSKYPNITFKSTSCSGSGSAITVKGDLTIRGKKKPVTTTLTVSADGSAFSAQGSFNIKATDYGFEPFSAMLGALKNKNKMTIGVNIVGNAN